MIYIINPSKDATIYSNSSSLNTGLDEILEVAKVMTTDSSRYINQALIAFDLTTFPSSTISGSASGSRKFYLKLYATEPETLTTNYDIHVLPVSGGWTMGQGKRYNTPQTTMGVSWDYKHSYTVDSGSTDEWWYVSSSIGAHNDYTGSTFYLTPLCSQSFNYTSADANVDVTSIVEQWIAGTIGNAGFVVKFPSTYEDVADTLTYGTLKFFSKDSNTIYKPRLILKYDDAVTGSGVPVSGTLSDDDVVVYVKGIKTSYSSNSIEKLRVLARDRFPAKTSSVTQSQYVSFSYLPTSSYYGVKDAYTGEMIVDFDSLYGKMSSDSSGNFFNFNFNTLFSNRLYKFIFKVERNSLVNYFDSNVYFTIVK